VKVGYGWRRILVGNLDLLLGATVIRRKVIMCFGTWFVSRAESPSSGSTYGQVSGDLMMMLSKEPRCSCATGLFSLLMNDKTQSYTAYKCIFGCGTNSLSSMLLLNFSYVHMYYFFSIPN
jgi:hypothetical protein